MFQADPRLDKLTGLLDRHSFVKAMADTVAPDAAGPGPAAVFLDIRRFAKINDALGPATGDELLRKFAVRLTRALPEGTVIGRLSGDSFAILIRDSRHLEEATIETMELCGRPFLVGGSAVNLTSHLGAARAGGEIASGYDLLQAAEIALHTSIDTGKRAVFYDASMKSSAKRSYLVEQDLRSCILLEQRRLSTDTESESFSLAFQPKVGSVDGRLQGFEGLLRWRMRDGTPVSPAEFIPIAERSGLMDAIGRWVVRAGFAALARWPEDITLAVNVSPAQLSNGDWLIANIASAAEEFGVALGRLEIEITESALRTSDEAIVHELARMGLKIWIDDFGIEYSSLARLCRLPFTGLKIDKSVTDGLAPSDPDSSFRLLSAIASIAGNLGLDTVIEGVEHEWQARRVREAGIAKVQGYLHAPPLDGADAQTFVRRWTQPAGGTTCPKPCTRSPM